MNSLYLCQKLQRDQVVSRRRREARMKVVFKKQCVTCGKEFLARTGSAKYCSDDCRPVYGRREIGVH